MLVKNWMSKTVVKIDVEDSMQQAIKLMKENNNYKNILELMEEIFIKIGLKPEYLYIN